MTRAITKGLLVTLEAKPGLEDDLARFLTEARELVADEPETTAWFAFRTGPTSFGIFDVFPTEAARRAHLTGAVAAALVGRAGDLLAEEPRIVEADVLADRIVEER
jgi:quinol monooxygenase YgiN